jgi:phosphoadenosine phosphosulfate reductase
MALWRKEGFVEDSWTKLGDAEPAPATGAIVVSAQRWRVEREALSGRADPVGVAVEAGKDAIEQLREAADRPLVVLVFAKFSDGRAFSYAEILRERFGFTGELRAGGDVLLDEIPLMLRCGFDSFEVTNEPTLRNLKRGHLPGVTLYYQPSVVREAPAGTRPWLRRPTGA